jgi:hypothetical protein
MKKYLINYADRTYAEWERDKFYESQKRNCNTGLEIGGFDEARPYLIEDLDEDFKEKNKSILQQEKGAGFWLWKPYIILKQLELMEDGDLLFYSDSACDFISSIDPLIEVLDNFSGDKQILLFELEDYHLNRQWTKRDCFIHMNMDNEEVTNSVMLNAAFLMMRKNSFVIDFVKEWFELCKNENLLTDVDNTLGKSNYDDFRSHRHDQSLLSLMGKKHDIFTIADISQYGWDKRTRFNSENQRNIQQVVDHHRKGW